MSNVWIEDKSENIVAKIDAFTYSKDLFGDEYSFLVYSGDSSWTIKEDITKEEAEYEYAMWKTWIKDDEFHLIEFGGDNNGST